MHDHDSFLVAGYWTSDPTAVLPFFLPGDGLWGSGFVGRFIDVGIIFGDRDKRRAVTIIGAGSKFGDVVEVGEELIVFLLRNRVELVIVATGA